MSNGFKKTYDYGFNVGGQGIVVGSKLGLQKLKNRLKTSAEKYGMHEN